MLAKVRLILGTVIHLKMTQVVYQVYYRIRSKFVSPQSFGHLKSYTPPEERLRLTKFSWAPAHSQILFQDQNLHFSFLNLEKEFPVKSIDWNFEEYGKLWNYNLNYFDFLFDEHLKPESGLELIEDYCAQWEQLKGGLEPYPISLRLINWVKFLSFHNIEKEEIDQFIFRQFNILRSNLEYHLLANHLLENAFSLLYGAYFFRNNDLYRSANNLLRKELNEQIMKDGAHYERSPMYHQIILYRTLDAINLVKNNPWQDNELLTLLEGVAAKMIG